MSAREEADPILERELVELFEPRRAEPERFREDVERRIEKLRAEKEKANAAPAPSWLRRVASMFPGDILIGAAGGSAAGKLAAAKLFPAALALPVLLLGSALGAFAAGVRSLKRSAVDAEPTHHGNSWRPEGPHVNRDLRIGSILRQLVWAVCLVGMFLSGTDWIFGILLISMAALTISMRGFASAGLMTRTQVGGLCVSVLYATFFGCFLLSGSRMTDASSALGVGWSATAVLGGIVVCFLASAPTTRRIAGAGLMSVVLLLLNPIGCTRSSPASLRDQIESMDLSPRSFDWDKASALHRALRLTGGPLPDLSAVRNRLEEDIEFYGDQYPGVWSEALDMGLIDAEHRAKLSAMPSIRKALDGVRTGSAPLSRLGINHDLVELLKDEALVDSNLRDRLASQLEAEWPQAGEFGPLRDAWFCVLGLDEIGAEERANALRDQAHRLLVSHWMTEPRAHGKRGGFTPDPVEFRSSFDGDTWYAVQLMERLGAPPVIDLRLLRGYLRTESSVEFTDSFPELEAMSRASLRVLEDCIAFPKRNWLQRILDERLLIASLLLVALCLTAIRLAPSPESDARHGALP